VTLQQECEMGACVYGRSYAAAVVCEKVAKGVGVPRACPSFPAERVFLSGGMCEFWPRWLCCRRTRAVRPHVVCVCLADVSAICVCRRERGGGSLTRTDSSSAAERQVPTCARLPGCCCGVLCRAGLCFSQSSLVYSLRALCTSQHASGAVAASACCCSARPGAVLLSCHCSAWRVAMG
jgi:hypothetical protein